MASRINRKGIVDRFLITILLAFIIFAPACLVASKFFRLSDQAKDNFQELQQLTAQLGTQEEGSKDYYLAILDEETAIVAFNSGSASVQSCKTVSRTTGLGKSYQRTQQKESCGEVRKPEAPECATSACICLLRSLVPLGDKPVPLDHVLEYKTYTCVSSSVDLQTPALVQQYKYRASPDVVREVRYVYKGGLLFGRAIEKASDHYYLNPKLATENRRMQLYAKHKNSMVFLCWEKTCEDVTESLVEESAPAIDYLQ